MTKERPVSRSPAAMTALSAASMASTRRAPGACAARDSAAARTLAMKALE